MKENKKIQEITEEAKLEIILGGCTCICANIESTIKGGTFSDYIQTMQSSPAEILTQTKQQGTKGSDQYKYIKILHDIGKKINEADCMRSCMIKKMNLENCM